MKTRIFVAALFALAVILPSTIVAVVVNREVDDAVIDGIEARLMDQAKAWRITAASYEKEIAAREDSARLQAKEIITAQTKIAYELVDKALTDNSGALPNTEKEDVLDRLSRHTVGRTGYIWIIDYDGNYILSQNRARDGENIWNASYDDENYPIQDIISTGKELGSSEVGFLEYLWANQGDPEPRYKIAAMMNFAGLEWVLGVSAYYDDLVSMDFRSETIEELKDLMAAQEVGRSGYLAVLDGDGYYVVSLNRERDGEDISQATDASGRFFVQEGIARAKAAGTDADIIRYPWQNTGEDNPREKIGGVTYYEAWDWIIWPNAYLDDFTSDSANMRWIILGIAVSALVMAFVGYETAPLIQRKQSKKSIPSGPEA